MSCSFLATHSFHCTPSQKNDFFWAKRGKKKKRRQTQQTIILRNNKQKQATWENGHHPFPLMQSVFPVEIAHVHFVFPVIQLHIYIDDEMMNDAGLFSKTIYPTQRVHERSLDTYFLFCRMVSLTKPSKNTFFFSCCGT